MNKILKVIAGLTLSLCFASSHAVVMLSINPASQTIGVNDITSIDLNISGLGDGTPPSLGAFAVEILFDETILAFDNVSYGSSLGSTDFIDFETDILTTPGVGSVTLDLFSFLFDFELDALQGSSFTLATLSFEGLADGTSLLNYGLTDLADAAFPSNTIVPQLQTASITVETAGIPEPATLVLFGAGLFGLSFMRRRKHRQ